MRKHRRRCRIDRHALNAPVIHPGEHGLQSLEVHRLAEHVLHHFAHQRMVGNLDIALDILLAGRHLRKNAGQQIVRTRSLNLWSDFSYPFGTVTVANCGLHPSASVP